MLKKLLGETALYGLSSIVGRALNFLLLPFYTQVFADTSEYGIITDLYVLIAFLNILFTFGMETTFFRFATKNSTELKEYFRLALSVIMVVSTGFGLIIMLGAPSIASLLGYEGDAFFVRCMALILLFDALAVVPYARLRLEGRAFRFASYRISSVIITIVLNLFFLGFCPWFIDQEGLPERALIESWYDPAFGVGYVLIANVISSGFQFVYFLPTWRQFKPLLNRLKLRPMLRYATPLLVLGLAGITNEMLSRQLVKYLLPQGFYPDRTNLEVLGIFGAAYKLSVFMALVVQAFKYAYEPFFFRNADAPDAKDQNSKVMTAFIAFTCGGWILIVTVLPEIAPIFLRRPDYLEALGVVPLLLGAGVLLGIFYNLSLWYKLTENNWYGAIIATTGAAVTIILNISLIPLFGYMGSAWASFCTYLVMVTMSYIWGQRVYSVPYRLSRGVMFFMFSLAAVLLISFVPISTLGRYGLGMGAFSILSLAFWKMEKPKLLSTFVR